MVSTDIAHTDVARIFLVDDHHVVRMGFRRLFEQTGRLSVAGEAASAAEMLEKMEALANVPETRPDVAVVDISMEEMDGIELTRRLKQTYPALRVLIVSMHDDAFYVREALAAGADGYVLKDNAVEVMVEAVDALLDGRQYFCSDVVDKIS